MTSSRLAHRRRNARRPPVCKKQPPPPIGPTPIYVNVDVWGRLTYTPPPPKIPTTVIFPPIPCWPVPGYLTTYAGTWVGHPYLLDAEVTYDATYTTAILAVTLRTTTATLGTAIAHVPALNPPPTPTPWTADDFLPYITAGSGGLQPHPAT